MATKKKASRPDITDVLKESMAVDNRVDRPEPQTPGILPPRWWEQGNVAASEASRPAPILTISPQVAQVLNMGIDRVVDVTTRLRGDFEFVNDNLNRYRWNEERIRTFLRNAHKLLSGATAETIVERAVVVVQGIDELLHEGMP